MATAHLPTILLLSLPQTTLVGLDTLALTPSPRFHGFNQLPAGWHFLYAGASASLSPRTGFWLQVPLQPTAPGPPPEASFFLRIFKWSSEAECLVPVLAEADLRAWRARLQSAEASDLHGVLLPYRVDKERITPAPGTAVVLAAAAMKGEGDDDVEKDDGDDGVDEPRPVAIPPSLGPAAFAALTSCIDPALLSRVTGSSSAAAAEWSISTTSSALEDRDDIPGLMTAGERASALGLEERELSFLPIDLKRTWREGAVGAERTRDARDRSGALERAVRACEAGADGNDDGDYDDDGEGDGTGADGGDGGGKPRREATEGERGKGERDWGRVLLGEMQVTFLMVLLLANWSCLAQWKRILELVLTSHAAVARRAGFFASFLELLAEQLQRCGDVEGGLFDVAGNEAGFLKQLLRGFRRALGDVQAAQAETSGRDVGSVGLAEVGKAMRDLEAWVREEWGWELGDEFVRRGMVELEDGERVEIEMDDMEGEDERGEYAPVVVELEHEA